MIEAKSMKTEESHEAAKPMAASENIAGAGHNGHTVATVVAGNDQRESAAAMQAQLAVLESRVARLETRDPLVAFQEAAGVCLTAGTVTDVAEFAACVAERLRSHPGAASTEEAAECFCGPVASGPGAESAPGKWMATEAVETQAITELGGRPRRRGRERRHI